METLKRGVVSRSLLYKCHHKNTAFTGKAEQETNVLKDAPGGGESGNLCRRK